MSEKMGDRIGWYVVLAVSALVVTISLAVLLDLEAGPLSEWVGAVATLAAVGAAFVIAARERNHAAELAREERVRADLAIAEERRIAREQIEAERAQADRERVAGVNCAMTKRGFVADRDQRPYVHLRAVNFTSYGIFSVVAFWTPAGHPPVVSDTPLGLPPGEEFGFSLQAAPGVDTINGSEMGILFLDTLGSLWVRHLHGELRLVGDDDNLRLLFRSATLGDLKRNN